MRGMRFVTKAAALALLAALGIAVAGDAVALDPQTYYSFAVSDLAVGTQTLSAAAVANGFVVLAYSGNTVSVLHGTGSDSDTIPQMLLTADRLLVVDGDRFYLRVTRPELRFALRPCDASLELVVSPATSIDLGDALSIVLADLADLGVGTINIDVDGVRSVVRDALKGPAEPQDLSPRLDYALYGLVVAEDWFAYASEKGIALLGLQVEVVVEKTPGASLAADFRSAILSESSDLVDLVLPIDQLVTLARSSGVGYVRLPYVPVAR